MHIKYNYESVPTVQAFIRSRKRYKYIQGPVGSGKSSGCVMHLFHTMCQQEPESNGVRRTRYVVIRNTYTRLMDTTKKTIDYWFPPDLGLYKWKENRRVYEWDFKLQDGTRVVSEWFLRALDDRDDITYLFSLELTGGWINEGKEVSEDVFVNLRGRIGRYPGANTTYPYIIIDSNPPSIDHWLYHYFVDEPSKSEEARSLFEFFKQPSGLSPEAENIQNLRENYYQELLVGQDESWINVYIHGEFGYVLEGAPVFPSYRDSIHCTDKAQPVRALPLIIGMDFGLYPAAAFTQQTPSGILLVIDELVSTEPTDLESFIKTQLLPKLNTEYYLFTTTIVGDPAGRARSQLDSRTCFYTLRSYGLNAYPAYTNSIHDRIKAVNLFLTKYVDGRPAFALNPRCVTLRKGFNGDYHFRRLRVTSERFADIPEKNQTSHVMDALQYACLGYIPQTYNRPSYNFSDRSYSYSSFT